MDLRDILQASPVAEEQEASPMGLVRRRALRRRARLLTRCAQGGSLAASVLGGAAGDDSAVPVHAPAAASAATTEATSFGAGSGGAGGAASAAGAAAPDHSHASVSVPERVSADAGASVLQHQVSSRVHARHAPAARVCALRAVAPHPR